jgi:hypothetical protein
MFCFKLFICINIYNLELNVDGRWFIIWFLYDSEKRLQYSFVNLIFYAQYKTLSLVPYSCVGKVLSFQIKVKEYWSLQYAVMF